MMKAASFACATDKQCCESAETASAENVTDRQHCSNAHQVAAVMQNSMAQQGFTCK